MDRDLAFGLSGAASEGESLQVAASEAAMRAGQGQGAADRAAAAAARVHLEAYTLSGADGSEQDLDANTVTVR
jgi:hypothetical protein